MRSPNMNLVTNLAQVFTMLLRSCVKLGKLHNFCMSVSFFVVGRRDLMGIKIAHPLYINVLLMQQIFTYSYYGLFTWDIVVNRHRTHPQEAYSLMKTYLSAYDV